MKTFNVKSNAKRYARQVAASFEGVIAAEPVEVMGEPGEWFPAVSIADGVAAPEGIEQSCVIVPASSIESLMAQLPPPVTSTEDEVRARLAERRQRIDEEKANPKPKTLKKKAIIKALISRDNGATMDDLVNATGWQRHTVRGFISGVLRKEGVNVKVVKNKGEPSIYVDINKHQE